MAITLALQSDKKLAFFDFPGVHIGTQESDIFIFGVDTAAAPLCSLLQRNSSHSMLPHFLQVSSDNFTLI